MRTTLNISDALAREAKVRAAAEGRTLTSFIEEALRDRLAKSTQQAAMPPLPAFGDGTRGMLVDLDDKESLWAVLDDAETRTS